MNPVFLTKYATSLLLACGLFTSAASFAQVYGTSINAGNFVSCPTANITCSATNTFLKETVVLGLHADGSNNGVLRFVIAKCDESTFINDATVSLFEGDLCSPSSTTSPVNISAGFLGSNELYYTPSFLSGSREIHAVVGSGGELFYGGSITIYAPPSAPTQSSIVESAGRNVIKWSNVSGEDGYNVFRASCSNCNDWSNITASVTIPANTTSFLDDDLDCGVAYRYRVGAYKNVGVNGAYSAFSNIRQADPVVPTGLTPGVRSSAGVEIATLTPTLDWGDVTGASGYAVALRSITDNQTLVSTTTTNSSFPVNTGVLGNGKTYQWKVSVDCGGDGFFSDSYYFTTPAATPPNLEFGTCISVAPNQIQTNQSINFACSVENKGGSVWSGQVRVIAEEVGNASNQQQLFSGSTSILAQDAFEVNISPSISLGVGSYRVFVSTRADGSSSWEDLATSNCSPVVGQGHYGELQVQQNVPGSLVFDECISAPTEVGQGEIVSGQITLRNPGTQTWTGNIDVFVDKTIGNYQVKSIYHAEDQVVFGGNQLIINFGDDGALNDSIMGPLGSYQIFVAYTNAPDGYSSANLDYPGKGGCNFGGFTFSETGTVSHRHFFVLTPPGQTGGCTITNPDPGSSNPDEVEAYTAASYLCNLGILDDPANGNIDPYQEINRGQLAKILYYGLLGSDTPPTVASSFPTPFLDLIDPDEFYYDAAKALSYLEYGDGKAPFDREFVNFNPLQPIQRGYMLKALLETFNIRPVSGSQPVAGVSPSHETYGYVKKACELELIDCDNPSYEFRPDDLTQRYEAFLLLYRLLEQCESCSPPAVQSNDFYYPINITPQNMGRSMGFADANFQHRTRTSFSIPGKKIPLVFEHSYNSFTVDLPEQIYEDYGYPLGKGWSHSYHAFIQKFEDYDEDSTKLVVFWPGNAINVYHEQTLEPITKNLYDEVADNGTTITVTKKNHVVFTFSRVSPQSSLWLLSSIVDRNNNTVELFYQNYSGGKKRLHKVKGTAGRELKFFYENAADPSFITRVEDPQRQVNFTYLEDNLKTYQDPAGKITTYNYGDTEEDEHLIFSIRIPKGNTITNTYENRKLNSTSTNEQTVTGAWSWTPDGVTNSVTTPVVDGNLTTNYSQDLNGNTTGVTVNDDMEELHSMTMEYNDPNNPYLPTRVEVNGDVTTYAYDEMGNVEQVAMPLGVTHQFAYTSFNDVDYYIDPRGNLTDFAYDGTGNLKTVTNALSQVTTIDYYPDGLVRRVTNPENIEQTFGYDAYGNLTSINAPEGISMGMTYDILSRMKTNTNPNGQVSRTYYQPDDLVDKVLNAAGNISDYSYDGNNNLTGIENVNGQTTTLTYDFNQDWLRSQSFGGKTDLYDYYSDGRLFTHTDPNGHTDTYTYDAQGRLKDDGYATYDYYPAPDNQLWKVTNENGTIEFTYDVLDRVKTTKDTYGNIITYDYDLNSNLKTVYYPDGKEVEYTYDAANQLKEVKDWNNNVTLYDYFADGRLKRADYPNGTFSTYQYDDAGRMTGQGNFKSPTDTINCYSYVLDPIGNHLQVTQKEPFGSFNWSSGDTIATYSDDNRIETFGGLNYSGNDNGNTTSMSGPQANYGFHWDTEDQLIQVDSAGSRWAEYEYDGLGHRRRAVRNGTATRYVLDILGMSKVLMETDDSNNPIHYYIHGLGQIARVDADGNYHYYHYDFRGSTIAMTDETKTTTHQYQYGPYGETLRATEADFNPYRYVGAQGVQFETNDLYFMRARYYDVQAKRFLSEDPIWAENLYGYANNSPIIYGDVNGEKLHKLGLDAGVTWGLGTDIVIQLIYDDVTRDIGFKIGASGNIGAHAGIRSPYQVEEGRLKNDIGIANETVMGMVVYGGVKGERSLRDPKGSVEPVMGFELGGGIKTTSEIYLQFSGDETASFLLNDIIYPVSTYVDKKIMKPISSAIDDVIISQFGPDGGRGFVTRFVNYMQNK